ncbi:MAG: trehalose-phosphatase [Actinobacteria bacterium]|nr:trehalose-phosphatase [Actinomycetota bacterium]
MACVVRTLLPAVFVPHVTNGALLASPAVSEVIHDLRAHAGESALLFDIDGVLAPIVPNPADARVPHEALVLLGALADRYLLAGVLSGRGMAVVDRMVPVPGIARGGNHGLEVAGPGERAHLVPGAEPGVRHLRDFVEALNTAELATQGAWMEDKGASVSLHYREAPDPTATGEWLRGEVRPAAIAAGLRTRDGKMILELLPDVDVHKGTALAAIVAAAGARRVLYVGDDQTDADAWRAMRDMVKSGQVDHAWCVLADGPEVDPQVRAQADEAVQGTEGALALMRALTA